MGSDTNELDTREDDKNRKERRSDMSEDEKDFTDLDVMESIETVVEEWQRNEIDSEEALKQIVTIVDEL
jgi:hypothetical protein